MFDSSLPDLEALASASDAEVVAAIEGWTRAEAAASARRLAGIAELVHRRVEPDGDARLYWACDFWDAAAAEVGAAMGISARRASTQMNIGLALRERLPKVAALFAAGALSYRVINTIAYRTHLVDDAALPALDDALASRAAEYGPLSEDKLDHALDGLITTYDPDARRQIRIAAHGRDVHIGDRDDMTGTATVWGRLLAHDAALLAQRFQQMIHGVCPEDPRTLAQRRADAMGALAAGTTTLTCICGRPDCPHAGQPDARSTSVIIHVTAEPAAVAGPRDPHLHGTDPVPADPPSTDPEPADPAPPAKPGMAYLLGGPALPTPLLAELIATGATVAPLRAPAEDAEPGYRPSKALADFVRARDMTCRFPGCGVPADRCDIDHALAWPVGPTHPSNLRCLCRKHHLLKTFRGGPTGWRDQQLPDATIVWTSPVGATYTTHPGSRILLPDWNVHTAALPPPPPARPCSSARGLMMPTRKRTRAADRAQRIKHERALNTERNKAPPQ